MFNANEIRNSRYANPWLCKIKSHERQHEIKLEIHSQLMAEKTKGIHNVLKYIMYFKFDQLYLSSISLYVFATKQAKFFRIRVRRQGERIVQDKVRNVNDSIQTVHQK